MEEQPNSKYLWRQLVVEAETRFVDAGVEKLNASTDIARIFETASGADSNNRHELYETQATQRQLAKFDAMLERRLGGEPLQYVIGSWGFRMLDLFVDDRVLIPRPETEIVAERASQDFARLGYEDNAPGSNSKPGTAGGTIADLGTGSGAIGLSLAVDFPKANVWLTDRSGGALSVARANLASLGSGGSRVRIEQGSWFEALPSELRGNLSMVVSNPPYIATNDEVEAQVANWEPNEALMSDDKGMADLKHIVNEAPNWLHKGGILVLEMDPRQIKTITDLASEQFEHISQFRDLAGRDRGISAILQ